MTTAFFIFGVGCSACAHFKATSYEAVKSSYIRQGVTVNERTTMSMMTGYTGDDAPKFVRLVKMYPACILIDNETLRVANNLSLDELFSRIMIMDAHLDAKAIKPVTVKEPMDYDFMSASEYNRFLDDFRAKKPIVTIRAPIPQPRTRVMVRPGDK